MDKLNKILHHHKAKKKKKNRVPHKRGLQFEAQTLLSWKAF